MRLRWRQYGQYSAVLRQGSMPQGLVSHALAVADEFSIAYWHAGLRVLADPGRKVRSKLVPSLRMLAPLPRVAEFWSARMWLGTSSRNRFVVKCPFGCTDESSSPRYLGWRTL